jgi:putative SOS response-associated peptidase YedK
VCSHYQAAKAVALLEKRFPGVSWLTGDSGKTDMWPKYAGLFIRRPPEHDAGDEAVPQREALTGRWGLVSALTKADGADKALKLSTFNARSEKAATSFTFGHAWRKAQHCIIPAEAFYEPDWRSGKAVPPRFTAADGEPMGIAGLRDRWRSATGEIVERFTMLTINADEHELLRDYHRPNDEKRMVVVLPAGAYDASLTAAPSETMDFMHAYPADALVATPVPKAEAPK